ncbi:hypothetical protein [Rhizobium ruizarguesonis]|jgi:hypothetical protein|nr:hypothetical protein [Rhizobium ruizarguesonis]NEH33508.1 hypothetical protein [Rhizobium ruizarguesonis]QJS31559.1 hypothetical protein RLTA1_30095 [Rhizobium leguminosarum bv. trifolii TA1]UFW97813.1 hypothetical protein RlegTA1_30050 [Rhizobium ruizarguesonis]
MNRRIPVQLSRFRMSGCHADNCVGAVLEHDVYGRISDDIMLYSLI